MDLVLFFSRFIENAQYIIKIKRWENKYWKTHGLLETKLNKNVKKKGKNIT